MTSTGYTFISYSRRQLYFAEAIALHLEKRGISVWFDLQQLDPGENWSSELNDGMANAERVILIASQAALASPYVEVEWQSVLARGAQVIVILVESVVLPDSLKYIPVFDFRNNFNLKIKQLATYLVQDKKSSPKKINKLGDRIPKMPAMIWAVLIVITGALLGIITNLRSVDIKNDSVSFYFLVVGITIWFSLVKGREFLNHGTSYAKLKRTLWMGLVLQWVALFALYQAGEPSEGVIRFWQTLTIFSLFVVLLGVRWSPDVLRWFQSGQASQKMRRRIHSRLIESSDRYLDDADERAVEQQSYYVHHDPVDMPFIKFVVSRFTRAGHEQVGEPESASYQLVLVTNRSGQQWLENVVKQLGGNGIYLIGSSIEFGEAVEGAGKYQWVDIRDGNTQALDVLARNLDNPDAGRREHALETTPRKFDALEIPNGIRAIQWAMQLFGVFLLIWGGSNILIDVFEASSIGNEGRLTSVIIMSVGIGYFILVLNGIILRRISGIFFYLLCAAILVGTYPLGAWFPSLVWILAALLLFSLEDGRYFFPRVHISRKKEVGISRTILKKMTCRYLIITAIWIVGLLGLYLVLNVIFPNV